MISEALVVLVKLCGIFALGEKSNLQNEPACILSISRIAVTFCSDNLFNLFKSKMTWSNQRTVLHLCTRFLNLTSSNISPLFDSFWTFVLSTFAYFFALLYV